MYEGNNYLCIFDLTSIYLSGIIFLNHHTKANRINISKYSIVKTYIVN